MVIHSNQTQMKSVEGKGEGQSVTGKFSSALAKIKGAFSSVKLGPTLDQAIEEEDKDRLKRKRQQSMSAQKQSKNKLDREFLSLIMQSSDVGSDAMSFSGVSNSYSLLSLHQ